MWTLFAFFVAIGLAVMGGTGFAVYELFVHIMPRETGVPLGCVFGTLAGLGTALVVMSKLAGGVDLR